MHRLNRIRATALLIFLLGIQLSACSPTYEEYRHDSPFEYYLYVPENYQPSGEYHLFIALHDLEQDGADCYDAWWRYAREVRFFLLCPTMPLGEEGYEVGKAENQLAAILRDVYSRYNLVGRFYLAGYGAGADFALPYAYRYPSAVFGVSVIDPSQLPSPAQAYNFPTLLLIDSAQTEMRTQAESYTDVLHTAGYTIRLIEVDGLNESLKPTARRMSVELYRDLTY